MANGEDENGFKNMITEFHMGAMFTKVLTKYETTYNKDIIIQGLRMSRILCQKEFHKFTHLSTSQGR
jgi:hypothetical protein